MGEYCNFKSKLIFDEIDHCGSPCWCCLSYSNRCRGLGRDVSFHDGFAHECSLRTLISINSTAESNDFLWWRTTISHPCSSIKRTFCHGLLCWIYSFTAWKLRFFIHATIWRSLYHAKSCHDACCYYAPHTHTTTTTT